MELSLIDTAATSSSDARASNKKGDHESPLGERGFHDRETDSMDSMLRESRDHGIDDLRHADDIFATSATIVTCTDDDPTLNPWTFRMFFLGRSFRI